MHKLSFSNAEIFIYKQHLQPALQVSTSVQVEAVFQRLQNVMESMTVLMDLMR